MGARAVALSALACLAAYALTWGSVGGPATPWWWLAPAAPLAWLAGLAARRPGWLVAGMVLMTALAGVASVRGTPALGLAAMGALLWGWDLAWLDLALAGYAGRAGSGRAGSPRAGSGRAGPDRRFLMGRAARRASAAVAAGVLLGLGFSGLRLAVPFWGLIAGALAAWAGAAAFIAAARRR